LWGKGIKEYALLWWIFS